MPNVDEIFQKANVAGCPFEEPKQRKEDPEKRGSFKDFASNTW